jgi:hypothetical protein
VPVRLASWAYFLRDGHRARRLKAAAVCCPPRPTEHRSVRYAIVAAEHISGDCARLSSRSGYGGLMRAKWTQAWQHLVRNPHYFAWVTAALAASALGIVFAQVASSPVAHGVSRASQTYVISTDLAVGASRPYRTTPPTSSPRPPSVLDLSTDAGVQGLAAQAFDRVVMGKIAFSRPVSMRLGNAAKIQARISKVSSEELTEGLEGKGRIELKDIQVSTLVRVVLLGDAFHVESLSTQDQPILGSGYTQWEWSVTPRRSGTQFLYLRVTLRLEIPNHGTEFLDRTVLTEPTRVSGLCGGVEVGEQGVWE